MSERLLTCILLAASYSALDAQSTAEWIASGRFTEAEASARKALAACATEDCRAVGLNNLATALVELGRYEEAAPLYRRAIELSTKSLGEDHPQTARMLSNLAKSYVFQGEPARAEPLLRRVVFLLQRQYGNASPELARDLHNLGALLLQQGRVAEATTLLQDAAARWRQLVPADHPYLLETLNTRALAALSSRRPSQAKQILDDAIGLARDRHAGHPVLAQLLVSQAQAHLLDKDPRKAARILEESLAIQFARLTPRHPVLRRSLQLYREALVMAGNKPRAQAVARLGKRLQGWPVERAFAARCPAGTGSACCEYFLQKR